MSLIETELRERAEAAARGILERRWSRERYELEPVRETEPAWSHIYLRAHYAAFYRVLERVGTALVLHGARGTRVVLGVSADRVDAPGSAPAEIVERSRALAGEALARASAAGASVRVTSAQATRDGHEVLVSGFAPTPEGLLQVELDADSGDVLGWHAPMFGRGSRDGCHVSRAEVVRRVGREQPLPRGADLAKAALEETPGARLWRLRFDVANEEEKGHVLVAAHARTGAVVAFASFLVSQRALGHRTARERAEAIVADALPGLLGPDATLVVLIPGVVGRGARRRAGWIGTASLADGTVARVAYADDEVEVAVSGESVKARVALPAPA